MFNEEVQDRATERVKEWNPIRRRLVEQVHAKTGGPCFYCGTTANGVQRCVDHFIPARKGGSDKIENLVPACRSCNSAKGGMLIEEFRMSRRLRLAYQRGVPQLSIAAAHWLLDNGMDIFDGVPQVAFWFEREGLKP
jgi:5-methylcytosine-specific restriction endonuclease McrA